MSDFETLRERLAERREERRGVPDIRIPSVWIDPGAPISETVTVDPIEWWSEALARIAAEGRAVGRPESGWTRGTAVYNLLVRTATAFDHDGDGRIGGGDAVTASERGTFLKCIALLPYIRSLGCGAVHLLPIGAIGRDGRKGALGSPYAVRDPYRLDSALAEPLVGLGAEIEFGAFVEASHRLGLLVGVEFALRTAAKDSDWAAEHPEWFYWIREDAPFASPAFPVRTLTELKRRVDAGVRIDLPPPLPAYRELFIHPSRLREVSWDGRRWVGRTADGLRARIPGAFSDWPPDDVQPPWGDVTYLRLFDHPDFDYMAYNTLRMYDDRLARPEFAVRPLWDRIAGVVPYYRRRYGIDAALIDMGHALPGALKARVIRDVRSMGPGFAFWDEDFTPSIERRDEGYDAVMGSFWWAGHRPGQLRDSLLRKLAMDGCVLPFFAAPETHNTPRSAARDGGVARSVLVWTLGCFLPAVPFVHAGFELGEVDPVNTGLDFSADEIERHPEERLGLYNAIPLRWTEGPAIHDAVRQLLAVRSAHLEAVVNPSPGSLSVLEVRDERVVCFMRTGKQEAILVAGRFGGEEPSAVSVVVPIADGDVIDPVRGGRYRIEGGHLDLKLSPWDAVVLVGRLAGAGDAAGR